MGNTKRNYFKVPESKREFIKLLYPVAVETESRLKRKGYGISCIAILAMAAVESAWGEGVTGNMYFEKKAEEDQHTKECQLLTRRRLLNSGEIVYPNTVKVLPLGDGQYKHIVQEWFKKYEHPVENFMEHFMDIVKDSKYASAVEVGVSTKLFINKLADAGYTYNKRYEPELEYAKKVHFAVAMINRNMDSSLLPPHSVELAPHNPPDYNPTSLI